MVNNNFFSHYACKINNEVYLSIMKNILDYNSLFYDIFRSASLFTKFFKETYVVQKLIILIHLFNKSIFLKLILFSEISFKVTYISLT